MSALTEVNRVRLQAAVARRLAIYGSAHVIRTLLALILAGVDAVDLAAWLDDLEAEL